MARRPILIRINLLGDVRPKRTFPLSGGIVGLWEWSAKWRWFDTLFLLAVAVMPGLGEYGWAVFFLTLSAFSLTSHVWHKDLTRSLKGFSSLGILAGFLLTMFILVGIKGQQPWSRSVFSMEDDVANRWYPLSADAKRPPTLPSCLVPPKAPEVHRVLMPLVGKTNLQPQLKSKPTPPSRGEVADVTALFVNPTKLSMMVSNTSKATAWDTKIEVTLYNLDEARNSSTETVLSLPLFVQVSTGDFLRAEQSYEPRTVLDASNSAGRLRDGDRLAGYGAVSCSNCQILRWYWIYYVEGKGGWYNAIPVEQAPDKIRFGHAIPQMTKNPEAWFGFIQQSERVPIQDAP